MRLPKFKDPRVATIVGLGLFVAGAYCLKNAFDDRGVQQPIWLRPFSFW